MHLIHADQSPGHAKQRDCLWEMVEVMGRSEDVAASVEVEGAGSRAGERNGEVHSTIGGGNVDSQRVQAARLATKGQYLCNNTDGDKTTYQGHPSHLHLEPTWTWRLG